MRPLSEISLESIAGIFPGWLRAVVVETNDPLNMRRVRFKCPDMHDHDLKPEDCPWALPCPNLGGPRSGSWTSPCIGDQIWVNFEKDHPYSPIWVGAADAARRKMYPLPSINTITPLPVDDDGRPADLPDDYNEDYLPKDGRPMSSGQVDRYGHMIINSGVGFFPSTHDTEPSAVGYDAIQKAKFKQLDKSPVANQPDSKYMVRISKYGHILLMGDIGYSWKGEFSGNAKEDEDWEIKRWNYLQRLLNEDQPSGSDQRKFMVLTRYGHLLEGRDVGWTKSRSDEYDSDEKTVAESVNDQRWWKLRTKGGMLFQMSDMGFAADDVRVNRKLLDEVGSKCEEEDKYWADKDGRWIRFISRHGFKIAIDDRGSSTTDADGEENPRGNGILLKGRRTPGSHGNKAEGDERGFFWEFNENDATNQTTWGTPLGQVIQLNDKLQYCLLVTGKRQYSRPFQRHKENEFLLSPLCASSIEKQSHHLMLDHHNEYLRLKTRAGKGASPDGDIVVTPKDGEQQGLECRDGIRGDGPWVELVDVSQRGLWFWDKEGYVICRAKQKGGRSKIEWWIGERNKEVVIRNNESGNSKIQIYCNADVEIIASSGIVNIRAGKEIALRAGKKIVMQGGSAKFELSGNATKSSSIVKAPDFERVRPNISLPKSPKAASTPRLQPRDRGKRYNSSLAVSAPSAEIEHPK